MGVKSNDDQELWESLYEIVQDYSEIASIQGLNYIFFPYQVTITKLITCFLTVRKMEIMVTPTLLKGLMTTKMKYMKKTVKVFLFFCSMPFPRIN